jgi:hypothetical protein
MDSGCSIWWIERQAISGGFAELTVYPARKLRLPILSAFEQGERCEIALLAFEFRRSLVEECHYSFMRVLSACCLCDPFGLELHLLGES